MTTKEDTLNCPWASFICPKCDEERPSGFTGCFHVELRNVEGGMFPPARCPVCGTLIGEAELWDIAADGQAIHLSSPRKAEAFSEDTEEVHLATDDELPGWLVAVLDAGLGMATILQRDVVDGCGNQVPGAPDTHPGDCPDCEDVMDALVRWGKSVWKARKSVKPLLEHLGDSLKGYTKIWVVYGEHEGNPMVSSAWTSEQLALQEVERLGGPDSEDTPWLIYRVAEIDLHDRPRSEGRRR